MEPNQQAYDRGSTIFSPDGRLYQVEYAREAVGQGATTVGVRAADGVALAAHRRPRSPLVEADSIEKLHALDDHLGAATTGVAADARRLVDRARQLAQRERLRYGEPADSGALAGALSDHVQEHTQVGGTRPYGVSLLLAGADGEPTLHEVDPGGTTTEWRAVAAGADAGAVEEHLIEEYDAGLSVDAAAELAVAALASAVDGLGADGLDVATVAPAFDRLGRDRRETLLAAA